MDLFQKRLQLVVQPHAIARQLVLRALDQVALRLNQRPRKTLGFEPPASGLQASVASTVHLSQGVGTNSATSGSITRNQETAKASYNW